MYVWFVVSIVTIISCYHLIRSPATDKDGAGGFGHSEGSGRSGEIITTSLCVCSLCVCVHIYTHVCAGTRGNIGCLVSLCTLFFENRFLTESEAH